MRSPSPHPLPKSFAVREDEVVERESAKDLGEGDNPDATAVVYRRAD